MLERFDEAESLMESLLQKETVTIDTSYKAALVFMRTGKTGKALEHLRICLEQGMSVRQAANEPILYENSQIQSLLSEFPAEEEPCS